MKTKKTVCAEVCTRNRYHTTLPLTLSSIAMQTVPYTEIIIWDDNTTERIDLREEEIYKDIFAMFDNKGIKWTVLFGTGEGQAVSHQKTLTATKCDLIHRIDDDNMLESNVLETLLTGFDTYENVGAVSCQIHKPNRITKPAPSMKLNRIGKGIDSLVAEWFKVDKPITDAQHLYSTYLYSREASIEAGGYPTNLSIIGHTEESQHSIRLYRAGYKLIILPGTTTWHFHAEGGIRSFTNQQLWIEDDKKFNKQLAEWGYKLIPDKLVHLSAGIGDHYAFKILLDDLYNKYKDHRIIISCAYPEVFEDVKDKYNLTLISNYDAGVLFFETAPYDVYKFMAEHNWTESLTEAYKTIYQI